MRFRPYPLSCACGSTPEIKEVGLTVDHRLVVHCLCEGCGRTIYYVKDLADCWRDCPAPDREADLPEAGSEAERELDMRFLQAIGVKMPE